MQVQPIATTRQVRDAIRDAAKEQGATTWGNWTNQRKGSHNRSVCFAFYPTDIDKIAARAAELLAEQGVSSTVTVTGHESHPSSYRTSNTYVRATCALIR